MEEEDIYKEDGVFVIKKEINGEMIEFGRFSNLDDAIEERDELEEYGWPYLPPDPDDELDEEDYGQYISKKNNLFVVSRKIRGKEKIFGEFKYLDDAKEYKYRLIENAWDDSFRNNVGRYGKFISKEGKKFLISRYIKGKLTRFGLYNTLDEAILAREKLIDDNWGVEGELNLFKRGYYGDYIIYSFHHYLINKTIDGIEYNFGIFDNLENAIYAREILIKNDWDGSEIPEELFSWRYFTKYNPHYKAFHVQNFVYNSFIDFGIFPYKNVKKVINILINNHWDSRYVPIDLYHKFSNIRYFKRKISEVFIVFRKINEEFISYGSFDNYEDAVLRRNELFLSNWDLTEIYDEEEIEQNIFLKDNLYLVKNEINGEMRIFGVFDNIVDAVDKRLECLKSNWSLFSISDISKNFSDSNGGYTQLSLVLDEDSLKKHTLNISRKSAEELLPRIPHECYSFITISGQKYIGNLIVDLKLKYFKNEKFQQLLEQLISKKESFLNIAFNLQYGSYPKFNKEDIFFDIGDFNLQDTTLFVPRIFFKGVVPFLNYEFLCNFNINNINCYAKLILEFRIELKEGQYIYNTHIDSISMSLNGDDEDKLNFLDIFKAYGSCKNNYFSSMPLLRAKNFGFLIEMCEMLYEGGSINEIKKILHIGPRQFNDYFKTAKYLNFLDGDCFNYDSIILTDKSIKCFSLDIKERNYEIFKAMLNYNPFYDLFTYYLKNKKVPSEEDSFLILNKYEFIESEAQIKTSAKRLILWLEWILERSYIFLL